MRLFLVKCTLFLAFLVLPVLVLGTKSSDYVNKFKGLEKQSLDVISLGTSHGNSFIFKDFNVEGARFNKAGNTIYYDLQNYYYLKPFLKKRAKIIIPISFFAFGLDENRTDIAGQNGSFVNEFYSYLPTKFIYNYSISKHLGLKRFYLKNKIKTILSLGIDEGSIKDKEFDFWENSKLIAERDKLMGEYSDAEKNVLYLSILIEDALSSDFDPILVTVPYHRFYLNNIGDDWLEINYYPYVYKIRDKFKISYFDYSNDERIVDSINFFHNSDHLNIKGAREFSSIFFKELGIRMLEVK